MRLFCTPTLLIYILFIHIVTAALHRKRDEGDTSLFELDEMDGNEDDTYRMIERMQDVSPEDQVEDDEIKEIERMDRQIQDEQLHIQEHESDNDNIPDEDEAKQEEEDNDNEEDFNSENNDEEEEEEEEDDDEEEEEDDDDDQEVQGNEHNGNDDDSDEIGPFDFKNDEEAEFFENLPISSPETQEEEDDHLKGIEEEELHNNTEDDEDELDELDEEEALAQPTMPIPQASKVEAPIPWQRPNPYGKIDTSSFYQDENAIRVVEKSRFKVWHGIAFFVVLGLAYRSLPRKKNNGLDLAWTKDEKDYLPLHNKGKYYKSEIKNC